MKVELDLGFNVHRSLNKELHDRAGLADEGMVIGLLDYRVYLSSE